MKSAGFTLIETIWASLILSFVVLFIMNLYPSSFGALRRSESSIIADGFAEQILEDLRSRAFNNVKPGAPPAYEPQLYGEIYYYPNVEVSYHPDAAKEHLKVAEVKVDWTYKDKKYQVLHVGYLHNVTR